MLSPQSFYTLALALTVCFSGACTSREATPSPVQASQPAPLSPVQESQPTPPLKAHTTSFNTAMCFVKKDAASTEGLKLGPSASVGLAGIHTGEAYDKRSGDYVAFVTKLDNSVPVSGGEIRFNAETTIAGDSKTGIARWKFNRASATLLSKTTGMINGVSTISTLQRVSCDVMEDTLGYAVDISIKATPAE